MHLYYGDCMKGGETLGNQYCPLGDNATLIGASANVVAAGICASRGRHVSFAQFLRIGLPIAVAQLSIGALHVLALASMLG